MATSTDIQDSPEDAKKLQPEKTTIDLPDVDDIPGQENIQGAPLGEIADTTISSDDEEGGSVFDDEDDSANVSEEERRVLEENFESMPTTDDNNLRRAELDNTDLEGTLLNEEINVSGDDLDVPGEELDDENEAIGEEDEENNEYSLGGDRHDP